MQTTPPRAQALRADPTKPASNHCRSGPLNPLDHEEEHRAPAIPPLGMRYAKNCIPEITTCNVTVVTGDGQVKKGDAKGQQFSSLGVLICGRAKKWDQQCSGRVAAEEESPGRKPRVANVVQSESRKGRHYTCDATAGVSARAFANETLGLVRPLPTAGIQFRRSRIVGGS
jgi:hypothetical protein